MNGKVIITAVIAILAAIVFVASGSTTNSWYSDTDDTTIQMSTAVINAVPDFRYDIYNGSEPTDVMNVPVTFNDNKATIGGLPDLSANYKIRFSGSITVDSPVDGDFFILVQIVAETDLAKGALKIDNTSLLGMKAGDVKEFSVHNVVIKGDRENTFDDVDFTISIGESFEQDDRFGIVVLYEAYNQNSSVEKIIDEGSDGGVDWTISHKGTLTIRPSVSPEPDENSGKVFETGAWREAVTYNGAGTATAVGGYPYDVNAITSLVIAEGVTSIGSFTAKFPNLAGEVIIPASVTYLGQEAFQNCSGITKITFAEGGTKPLCIAPGALKNLGVEEIVFPADRPEIHIHCWALNDCKSLKKITFPANVTTFSNWTHVDYCGMDFVNGWDSQILARCTALESITFGSQDVHDLFFAASGNTGNINAIGGVEIIVLNNSDSNP